MSSNDDPAAACPVDHKTREAWLAQARANGTQNANPHSAPTAQPQPQSQSISPVQTSCDSSTLDQSPHTPVSAPSPTSLGTTREISTIPRALPTTSTSPSPSRPANNERDTGASPSGNWIYPSERMFFDAMRRKAFSPSAPDMRTIVPIHNAVNERAWWHIKQWEAPYTTPSCDGPKLASFSGLSTTLTPRARWRTWIGYQAPFDRHDWVVDRCGERVEYVIDFYAGKGEQGKEAGLNFYLDVRPKLNSWEGVKMRAARFWGLV
ncbi:Cytochrome c1 heme lyase [Coniothyrium glycines]